MSRWQRLLQGLGWIMVGAIIRLFVKVILASVDAARAWKAVAKANEEQAQIWAEADEKAWR